MRRNTAREAMAALSLANLANAMAQGPRVLRGMAMAWFDTDVSLQRSLLHPGLGDHPVELPVELEIADPFADEVKPLRREEADCRCLVRDLSVDFGPHFVGGFLVGDAEIQRLLHLGVDVLVAEAGDVDRGIR